MRVVDYFSEASWGGWTMLVAGKDAFHHGDIIQKDNREFKVEKIQRLSDAENGETSQLIWLSPNNHVPHCFEIGEEIVTIKY